MLRSEKMENLIFNGAKKRRASSLAEVTLTFENTLNILPTEFANVTVSRQYFRNGESEYRLNNVPCRLKDILSLFMDTGISSDSYAIIELSMIEDILSNRDNSRRKLFEQAAGIEKYKYRKRETFNKLKNVDADLDRIDDLLYEIDNNLKSLESQARRTKRYYKLRDQYKELSIELSVLLLSDQKAAFKNINDRLQSEQENKLSIEAGIQKLEAALQEEKANTITKEKSLAGIQKQLNETVSNLQQKEGEKKLTAEKLKNFSARKERLMMDVKAGNDKLGKLGADIKDIEKKLESEREVLAVSERMMKEVQQKLSEVKENYLQVQGKTKSSESDLRQLESKIHQFEKQMAVNRSMLENLEREAIESDENISTQQSEVESLKSQLKAFEKAHKEKEATTAKLIKEENKLREQLLTNDRFVENLKQELASENRQLDAKRNEYQLTKDLMDNLEGYPESIKFLKKEVKHTRHAPLLSDILSCPDQYKTAIENFLEPYLNYYVVKTWDEAIDAVNILSDAAKGRANFFILEEFDHYNPTTDFPADNRMPAISIMEVDRAYQKLASFLLDRVYFVEDIRAAGSEGGDILLTTNGKYIKQRFSLAGGAIGLFEGKKIGRAKNLEKLSKSIKTLEAKTAKISKELNQMVSRSKEMKDQGLAEAIHIARNEEMQAARDLSSVKAKLEQLEAQLAGNVTKSELAKKKIIEITNENEQISLEFEKAQVERKDVATQTEGFLKQYDKVSAELATLNEKYSQENIEFHKQEAKTRSYEQSLSFSNQIAEETRSTIESNKMELESIDEQSANSELTIKELNTLLTTLYEEKESIEKQVSSAEEVYYNSRGVINEIEENIRQKSKTKDQADHLIGSLKEKLADLKLDLTSMKERLAVEFKVNLDDLLDQEPTGNFTMEELDEKVENIKMRLANYGDINPLAVEAFDEMKTRQEFIQSQKSDLLDARENLNRTINEIDNTAKEKFIETYEQVRVHFKNVFHRLFSEDDTCDLLLVDPENPLESGIEIIAKPKGKKPLTISQLSGGEKSLTATALLFALYLIKPAPFCIFDEVDAPLDDVNIGKFVNIIRDFSSDSQFIVVTHNKSTMASVDVIYGVTMIEEGVSRVVPVDLTNLN